MAGMFTIDVNRRALLVILLIVVPLTLGVAYYYYTCDNAAASVEVRMFYVDWCGYSKQAMPGFRQFMREYDGTRVNGHKIAVTMIDCEKKENAELANKHKVSGYPTFVLTAANSDKQTVYHGSDRTSDGFATWVRESLTAAPLTEKCSRA